MYGEFLLLEGDSEPERAERILLGSDKTKDEAWLRDQLFAHPEIIPVTEVDPTFGPLVPLCRELRTDAGPIDAVFINSDGRLTIVECKLWKNPQSRREVIAQTLDYVSALSQWTYADLQRQVAAATQRQGNFPFDAVRNHGSRQLNEHEFVDAVSRSLREGRILALIVGDGIREGLKSLAELVNRSATKAFSLGLIEVALYKMKNGSILMQPRVLAQTEVLTRQITIVKMEGAGDVIVREDDIGGGGSEREISGGVKDHLKEWWRPLLSMKFDDPEQEPPKWVATNNVVLNTPFPGIQIKAWASVGSKNMGVFVSGTRAGNVEAVFDFIERDDHFLRDQLPANTRIDSRESWPILLTDSETSDDLDRRAWLTKNLNTFVNVLRPRLKQWYEETK